MVRLTSRPAAGRWIFLRHVVREYWWKMMNNDLFLTCKKSLGQRKVFFPWHDGHESQSLMSHPDSLIETAGARARAQLEVYLRWWSMNKNSWRFATRPAVNFDLQKDAQKCLIIRGWLFDDRIARLIFFPGLQLFVFFGGVVWLLDFLGQNHRRIGDRLEVR